MADSSWCLSDHVSLSLVVGSVSYVDLSHLQPLIGLERSSKKKKWMSVEMKERTSRKNRRGKKERKNRKEDRPDGELAVTVHGKAAGEGLSVEGRDKVDVTVNEVGEDELAVVRADDRGAIRGSKHMVRSRRRAEGVEMKRTVAEEVLFLLKEFTSFFGEEKAEESTISHSDQEVVDAF